MQYFSGKPAGKIENGNFMNRQEYKLIFNRFSTNVVLRMWTRFI
jgi:hypothetical protein